MKKRLLAAAIYMMGCPVMEIAHAEDAPNAAPAQSSAGNFLTQGPTGGVWQQDQMLGDVGGARSWLGKYGVTVGLTETSEILGNTSGGVKKTFDYDGLTTATVQLDTSKALGWDGGTFNVSGMHLHGNNLSASNLQNLQTASGIEADPGFRLWEAWYDQSMLDDHADIKVGQQSIDQEFMASQYSSLYVNTMFGWPMVPSADMIGGGPAYPLSSLGARAQVKTDGPITLLAGVFDDNPSGLGPTSDADSQKLDDRGTNFRLHDSALMIGEIQYSTYPGVGQVDKADKLILPGTYKLGGWYDAGRFADQRFGTDGLSQAVGNGDPRLHRGNYSIYAVVDQMLWRESAEGDRSIGFFVRPMIAPDDRNAINFSVNGGLNFKGLIEGRGDDVFGLGVGYTTVSNRLRDLDSDTVAAGTPMPVQSNETILEATYQYQVAPWWVLQPDFQYVFNPGGGVPNPNDANGARIKNETILGLRTNLTF